MTAAPPTVAVSCPHCHFRMGIGLSSKEAMPEGMTLFAGQCGRCGREYGVAFIVETWASPNFPGLDEEIYDELVREAIAKARRKAKRRLKGEAREQYNKHLEKVAEAQLGFLMSYTAGEC